MNPDQNNLLENSKNLNKRESEENDNNIERGNQQNLSKVSSIQNSRIQSKNVTRNNSDQEDNNEDDDNSQGSNVINTANISSLLRTPPGKAEETSRRRARFNLDDRSNRLGEIRRNR